MWGDRNPATPLSSHTMCTSLFETEKTAGRRERELIFSEHHHKHEQLPASYMKKKSQPGWETVLKHAIFNEDTGIGIPYLCGKKD